MGRFYWRESFQAAQWFDICSRNRITLNHDKFLFGQEEVDFAGLTITLDNVRPCKRFLQAIQEIPVTNNITDVRSWIGLINQVSPAFSMASHVQPLRQPLKPDTKLYGNTSYKAYLKNPEMWYVQRLKKVCGFLTNLSQHMSSYWLVKIRNWFLGLQKYCKCSKTAPFCCRDGWTTGWHIQLNLVTHRLKVKHSTILL